MVMPDNLTSIKVIFCGKMALLERKRHRFFRSVVGSEGVQVDTLLQLSIFKVSQKPNEPQKRHRRPL